MKQQEQTNVHLYLHWSILSNYTWECVPCNWIPITDAVVSRNFPQTFLFYLHLNLFASSWIGFSSIICHHGHYKGKLIGGVLGIILSRNFSIYCWAYYSSICCLWKCLNLMTIFKFVILPFCIYKFKKLNFSCSLSHIYFNCSYINDDQVIIIINCPICVPSFIYWFMWFNFIIKT